jgi:hypothetical protein
MLHQTKTYDGYCRSSMVLRNEVIELSQELESLIQEHDSYAVEDVDDLEKVGSFLESFPIETLKESLEFEKPPELRKIELKKFSLPYLKVKLNLKHQFEKKEIELNDKKALLRAALIDELLEKIKIINENSTAG